MMRPVPVALGRARALAFAAGLVLGLAALGCGARTQARRGASPDDAIVHIQCNEPEAELWVNERFIGPVGALGGGVALSPGSYRVEVRHQRYHTFYAPLTVQARERRTLEAVLAEALP